MSRPGTKLRVYAGKYVKTLRLPNTPMMKEFILGQDNFSKSMYYLILSYLRERGGKVSDVCMDFQARYEAFLIHGDIGVFPPSNIVPQNVADSDFLPQTADEIGGKTFHTTNHAPRTPKASSAPPKLEKPVPIDTATPPQPSPTSKPSDEDDEIDEETLSCYL